MKVSHISNLELEESCSGFPAMLTDVLSVCSSFRHDQRHNCKHQVNKKTQQRRREEVLVADSGYFLHSFEVRAPISVNFFLCDPGFQ